MVGLGEVLPLGISAQMGDGGFDKSKSCSEVVLRWFRSGSEVVPRGADAIPRTDADTW